MRKKKTRKPGGGRHKLPEGQHRVPLCATVAPGTLARIDARAEAQGVSRGVLLDQAFIAQT